MEVSESKTEAVNLLFSIERQDATAATPPKSRSWTSRASNLVLLLLAFLTLTVVVILHRTPLLCWSRVSPSSPTTLSLQSNVDPLQGCRREDVSIRREWSTMPLEDRKAFTAAVNCLYDRPSRLDHTIFPAAKNRYDDFVGLHINMTLVIHFSGFFLPWHRHFLWLWTQALKKECGYQGSLPYWQWEKYADKIHDNLLFDGVDGSMSGDGIFDGENRTGPDPGFPRGPLPRGDGGGCLKSGPFKGRMLSFGPYAWSIIRAETPVLPEDWADWRPQCLNRDLTSSIARINHNHSVVHNLLYSPQTLSDWMDALQGTPQVPWLEANPHAAGHFLLGGPGADFFASPGDPAFYLHHSNVD